MYPLHALISMPSCHSHFVIHTRAGQASQHTLKKKGQIELMLSYEGSRNHTTLKSCASFFLVAVAKYLFENWTVRKLKLSSAFFKHSLTSRGMYCVT